jgi:hypothetical protein
MRGQHHFLRLPPLPLPLLHMKNGQMRSNVLKRAHRTAPNTPEYCTSSPSLDGDELRRVIRFLAAALAPARAVS